MQYVLGVEMHFGPGRSFSDKARRLAHTGTPDG